MGYFIYSVNVKSGKRVRLIDTPMTANECQVMASKFSNHPARRIVIGC